MRALIVIAFITLTGFVSGQTVLLMHDVQKDQDDNWGPGKTNHIGNYLSYGMVTGPSENDSVEVLYGKSYQISYGHYYKYEPTRFFAMGYLMDFNFKHYRISQEQPKVFASPDVQEWEKLWLLDVNFSPFIRFNFVKRGDHLGLYLDLAGYSAYNFMARHVYRRDNPYQPSESTRVANRDLKYIERWEYGLMARVGIKNIVLFGKYRMSNHFKPFNDNTYPELPRYTFGIAIAG